MVTMAGPQSMANVLILLLHWVQWFSINEIHSTHPSSYISPCVQEREPSWQSTRTDWLSTLLGAPDDAGVASGGTQQCVFFKVFLILKHSPHMEPPYLIFTATYGANDVVSILLWSKLSPRDQGCLMKSTTVVRSRFGTKIHITFLHIQKSPYQLTFIQHSKFRTDGLADYWLVMCTGLYVIVIKTALL